MSTAIPIPLRRPQQTHTVASTTPSLQSVLDQRKLSHSSVRSISLSASHNNSNNNSNNNNNNSSPTKDISLSSLPSLASISSLDSADYHPLDRVSFMDDIDQNFFDFSNDTDVDKQLELKILKPILSTPTLRQINSQENIDSSSKYSSLSSSFFSNLTKSIKSFTNSAMHRNNDLLFEIQPRLTDDRIPQSVVIQKLQKLEKSSNNDYYKQQHSNELMDQELETYKITAKTATLTTSPLISPSNSSSSFSEDPSSISIIRNKEPRINSQFLRLYAYEASSRQKGLLPEISQDEETQLLMDQRVSQLTSENWKTLTDKEFAIIVRQRLWNCVVLPPKEEDGAVFHTPEYVYLEDDNNNDSDVHKQSNKRHNENKPHPTDDDNSLMRKLNNIKPWVKLEDEENYSLSDSKRNTVLKPRGTMLNGSQFIVKGWCNSRWIAQDL